jgi:cytochrome c-type biogenesis protein CcmH
LDLRDKTYRLIKEGKDESEVKQWMIDRYGDFVLYKPPFKKETLVLWIGPGVLFFIAMFVVVRIARKNGNNKEEIDQKQQQKIHDLMQSEEKQ